MAANVTKSGQLLQGFLVPADDLTWSITGTEGTQAGPQTGTPEVETGTTTLVLEASGTPTLAVGQGLYLFPTRPGAPGPDGCAFAWGTGASLTEADDNITGWDHPAILQAAFAFSAGTSNVLSCCSIARTPGGDLYILYGGSDGTTRTVSLRKRVAGTWSGPAIVESKPIGGTGRNPVACLCALEDGTVTAFIDTNVAASFQLRRVLVNATPYTTLNEYPVLPAQIDTSGWSSTGVDIERVTAASLNGQVVLFCHSQTYSSGGFTTNRLYQYASSDGGQTFAAIANETGARCHIRVVATDAAFVAVYDANYSSGANFRYTSLSLGSAFDSFKTSAVSTIDATKHDLVDPGMVLAYDPAGVLWFLRTKSGTGEGAGQYTSIDGGQTWGVIGATGDTNWIGPDDPDFEPSHCQAVWDGDLVQVAMRVESGAGSDWMGVRLLLGGWTPFSAPAGQRVAASGSLSGDSRFGFLDPWIPNTMPEDYSGWTYFVSSGTPVRTVDSLGTGAGELRLTHTMASGDVWEYRDVDSVVSSAQEVVVRATMKATGSAIGYLRAWSVNATDGVGCSLTIDTGGIIMGDLGSVASATVRTFSGSDSSYWWEITLAVHRGNGRARVFARRAGGPDTDDTLNRGASTGYTQTLTLTTFTPSPLETACEVGGTASGSGTVDLCLLQRTFVGQTAAGSGIWTNAALPAPVGRQVTSEAPVLSGGGISLRALAGSSSGSAVHVVPIVGRYALELADPRVELSPRRGWRSVDAPAVVGRHTWTITARLPDVQALESPIWGVHLEQFAGFDSILVEYLDGGAMGGTWRSVATFGLSGQVSWTRYGTSVVPSPTGAVGLMGYFEENELAGGFFCDTADANSTTPIIRNRGGAWQDGATVAEARASLYLDPTAVSLGDLGSGSTTATGRIVPPVATIVFQPRNVYDDGTQTGRIRAVRISTTSSSIGPGADAPRCSIGKLVVGPVLILGRELSRTGGYARDFRSERVTYDDGTVSVTRRGPDARRWEFSLSHSYSALPADPNLTSQDYVRASGTYATPLAGVWDAPAMLEGVFSRAEGGTVPVVYIPTIPASLTDVTPAFVQAPKRGRYGLLSGTYRKDQVIGQDGTPGVGWRIATLTLDLLD